MHKRISYFREFLSVPNMLSLVRIPLALIMILFYENKVLFFILLGVAIFSDWLDGFAARKMATTRLGALLDPLCDKIFVLILLLFLVFSHRITLLALFLLLIRDIFTTALFAALFFSNKRRIFKDEVKARWSGKIVTVSQFVALVWIFLGLPYLGYMLGVVAALSVAAVIDYSIFVRALLKK